MEGGRNRSLVPTIKNKVSEGITPLIELCPVAFTQKKKRVRVDSLGSNPEGIISSKVGELGRAIGGKPIFVDLQERFGKADIRKGSIQAARNPTSENATGRPDP